MPTKADFEAAAEKLQTAAQQVGDLTAAAEGAGASEILRGGSLGRRVPECITTCANSATTCKTLILDARGICLERVGIIEDYEAELEVYDEAYAGYQSEVYSWNVQYNWWYTSPPEAPSPHPGPYPTAPPKPADPPEWADVRRV